VYCRRAETRPALVNLEKVAERLQAPVFIPGTDDNVIQDLNLQELTGLYQIPSHLNIIIG
jgi:hypothetical protein